MVEEAMVYCGSCGETLSATARFCRSCGASQDAFVSEEAASVSMPGPAPSAPVSAPPPAAPPPPPQAVAPGYAAWTQPRSAGNRAAALLAIAGGVGMCFMVLYSIVYYPLHHHVGVFFGESLQFGDLLAFCSGAVAIAIGAVATTRAPSNPRGTGAWLIVAGVPTLALTVLWGFPETFHLDFYLSKPIYFGFVFFSPLGSVHVGDAYGIGHLQVPLLAASTAVALGGCLMAFTPARSAGPPIWR